MVFSSLVFIYLFLPLCLMYYIFPNIKTKNIFLLFMSLFFYAWGEPVWVILLLFSGTIDYFHGLIIEKYRDQWQSKAAVVSSLVLNLSLLGFFKYSGFLVENINMVTGLKLPVPSFALPIGISFYTFQTISYVIDVYRRDTEVQHSFTSFMLYVSLFPQLVAGPIIRYSDIAVQIDDRKASVEQISAGITRFIIGLGKKVLIANVAGELASSILNSQLSMASVVEVWLGVIFYSFQIYFDFSGYSDMAIGLGKMFGFDYKENFNYPYIAKNVTDFWRRWHISLSSFFRDYVYIPLGGNRRFMIRNFFIVWFLTGLWHGASWNFIFWGLYYFILLIVEKFFLQKLFERIPSFFSRIYTIVAIIVGWVFFYFTNLGSLFKTLQIMFGFSGQPFSTSKDVLLLSNNAVFLIVAIIACFPIAPWIKEVLNKFIKKSKYAEFGVFALNASFNLAMILITTAALVGSSYNPFLYFRF